MIELSLLAPRAVMVRDPLRVNRTHRLHVDADPAGRRDGTRHQPAAVRQAERLLSVGETGPSAVARRELPVGGRVRATRGQCPPPQRVRQRVIPAMSGPAQAIQAHAFPADSSASAASRSPAPPVCCRNERRRRERLAIVYSSIIVTAGAVSGPQADAAGARDGGGGLW